MRRFPTAFALAAGLFAAPLAAAEGMWVPQQLPEIAGPLREAGLELPPEQLADLTGDPLGAVVALGGCTASFVSPEGLVATNHHCAYGAIQLNSTPERNLMALGFNAATQEQELSAGPNARVFVMDRITDVTAEVRRALAPARDGLARQAAFEAVQRALVADCEREPGYRCTLSSFFGGQTFRLVRQLEIRDVRLVYAPPSSIGNFGGEIDNWMWPRHTGDFTFYRAYVGPDGRPAAYAPENVPFRPRHWLRLADAPLKAGDFVMVAGFPGRTQRYALYEEFRNAADWQFPVLGRHLRNTVALVERAGAADPEVAVRYATTVRGWQNAMKNWEGQLAGFARIDAAARKRAAEVAVLDWLRAGAPGGGLDAAARREALAAHQRLVAHILAARAQRERNLVFTQIGNTGLLAALRQAYRLSRESAKPDAERMPGFQQRDRAAIEGAQRQLERRYVRAMEVELLAYWLGEYARLPAAQRLPALDALLGDGSPAAIREALGALYARTTLEGTEARLALLSLPPAELEAHSDPLLRLVVALFPTWQAIEDAGRALAGEDLRDRPAFLAAVQAHRRAQGGAVYPDANLSLRLTFGQVRGYAPRDGVAYTPFTTLEGLAAKATGVAPFDAPQAQLEAIRERRHGRHADAALGTVPVNFLSDLDITGGNSGSPVLDARGRLVGLAFDGNWESVSSNWVFDPAMTRMIAVDSRYMLWVMEHAFPAPRVLAELDAAAR
jgi:hypothetical protein